LNDSFTLINLLPQQFPKIATLGSKNVLPDRLISEKDQCIGHELPGAFQLAAHGRNKH